MEQEQPPQMQHRRARSITSLHTNRTGGQEHGGTTVLHVLVSAYQVRWRSVEERLATHPIEASKLGPNGHSVLYLALVRRTEDYPPGRVVRAIVRANPQAVWERPQKTTLLEIACSRMASLETLEVLTETRPTIPEDASSFSVLWRAYSKIYGDEDAFVAFLSSGSAEAFHVGCKLQMLLRYLTTGHLMPCTLETAMAAARCSLDLFKIFCTTIETKIPRQPLNAVRTGTTKSPLHVALARGFDSEVQLAKLEYLLSRDELCSSYVHHKDADGLLPLHVALRGTNTLHGNFLRNLSSNFDNAILSTCDPETGFFPFQMAALGHSKEDDDLHFVSAIYLLLRPVPHLIKEAVRSETQTQRRPDVHVSRCDVDALCNRNEPIWISPTLEEILLKVDGDMYFELVETLRKDADHDPAWHQLIGAANVCACPAKLMRLLISMHPEKLREPDRNNGWLPLHHAIVCRRGCDADNHEVFDMILDSFPGACLHRDRWGRLPLHLACLAGKGAWMLEKLHRHHPGAMDEADPVLRLPPVLIAAQSFRTSLTIVFHLLTRSPDVLMAS